MNHQVLIMEPKFNLDINGDPSPKFKQQYTIKSTVAGINQAANKAELMNIDSRYPNHNLYDLLKLLNQYEPKPTIGLWAESLLLYHRLWGTQAVVEYPNALLLGGVLCFRGSIKLEVMSFLLGVQTQIVYGLVNAINMEVGRRNLMPGTPDYPVDYYIDLVSVYYGLTHEALAFASQISTEICRRVQLLPIGHTETVLIASVCCFFASLQFDLPAVDVLNIAQVTGVSSNKFVDTCDWIWCDWPQMGLDESKRRVWYYEEASNCNIVAKLCEECTLDSTAPTQQATNIPQGLWRNGKLFVALGLLQAMDLIVPEPVSTLVLKTGNRSAKQLETWTQQIKQYLK